MGILTKFFVYGLLVLLIHPGSIIFGSESCRKSISGLDPQHIRGLISKARADRSQKPFERIQTAIRQSGDFQSLLLNETILRSHHDGYTHVIPSGEVTNQQMTGCCWIYAGLNMLRTQFIRDSGLSLTEWEQMRRMVEGPFSPTEFEFSYAYLYFFEKLEKANKYFEEVIRRLLSKEKGHNLREKLDPMKVVDDGGYFSDFAALVSKYGLVPYEVMPDTASSVDSSVLISEIADHVALGAYRISQEINKWKRTSKEVRVSMASLRKKLREIKMSYIEDVVVILRAHLGTPPESFQVRRWSERQESGNEGQPALYERSYQIETYTPLEFSQKVVGYEELEYVTVSYNPLRPRDRSYLVQPSSASEHQPLFAERFLNLDRKRLHALIVKAVKAGHSVWFAADINQSVHTETGVMHPNIFAREGVYNLQRRPGAQELPEDAAVRFFRTYPNHAMLITAVDIAPDGKVVKYGVENSWGDEVGELGLFHMYREWFDKYGYEVIVPLKLLSPREQRLWRSDPKRVPKDDWYY